MKCLVGLLFVLSTVMCAEPTVRPKPCETPEMYETKYFQYIHERNLTLFAKLSYDGPGQRVRVAEMVEAGKKPLFYDVILLYPEKKMYLMEIKATPPYSRTCKVYPLNTPFHKSEIPADAKFVFQSYIGSSGVEGAGLLVNSFSGVDKVTKASYMVTVTNTACIPVRQYVAMPKAGPIVTSFYDVTLGIGDPNRFVPPAECPEDAEMRPLHPVKARKHLRKGPFL